MNVLAVGIGGAAGASIRYLLGEWLQPGSGFPYITMLINWAGSLFFAYLFIKLQAVQKQWLKFGITTGFLGGFTTFSTFSVESIQLLEQHLFGQAAIYIGASSVGSIICCYMAYQFVQKGVKRKC